MTVTHLLQRELKRFMPLHQARIDCLAQLMVALIQTRSVNLTQLALTFSGGAAYESSYKRLQRFFRQQVLETDQTQVGSRAGAVIR